jgi:hypothetical protein
LQLVLEVVEVNGEEGDGVEGEGGVCGAGGVETQDVEGEDEMWRCAAVQLFPVFFWIDALQRGEIQAISSRYARRRQQRIIAASYNERRDTVRNVFPLFCSKTVAHREIRNVFRT